MSKIIREALDATSDGFIGPKLPSIFNFNKTDSGSMIGSMLDRGGVRASLAGAAIGGATSYATGGEFGAGALAGGSMAFGAKAIHKSLAANSEGISASLFRSSSKEGIGGKMAAGIVKNGASIQRIQERHAMMAGAGLFGVVGGGDRNRNNHRRGFNAHRGNGF